MTHDIDDRDLADVAMLIGLGLSVQDIETLWGVERAGYARAAAEKVLASRGATPIGRQASVGLELIQTGSIEREHLEMVLSALRVEDDEPPERYRDPIMLTLMTEPMVLSSGHCFDKSTIYDERGRLRFERCPLTRQTISTTAYPLLFLKREIVEWKLRRLDNILAAAARCDREPMKQLLAFGKGLLDTLGSERYQERAATYWQLRFDSSDIQQASALIELLTELSNDLHSAVCGTCSSDMTVARLVEEKSLALVHAANALVDSSQPLRAVELAQSALTSLPAFSRRESWVDGWVRVMRRVLSDQVGAGGPMAFAEEDALRTKLASALDKLHAPSASRDSMAELGGEPGKGKCEAGKEDLAGAASSTNDAALRYWTIRLDVCTSDAELLRQLVRLSDHALRGQLVESIRVSGAGVPSCNGLYLRDGDYAAAPLFKHVGGRWWMLRYSMPSGNMYWYIADKNQLDHDVGDLYRIKSRGPLPPCDLPWGLARDGVAPAPSLSAVLAACAPEGSELAALFSERRQRLESRGVDVSCLNTKRAAGSIARIGGDVGDFVHRVTLTLRESGEATLLSNGDDGSDLGRAVDEFELRHGEYLVGVKQWISGQHLGTLIRFLTSAGRTFDLRGDRHEERRRSDTEVHTFVRRY